jgi:DNA-binding NtrC family response regulator
MTGAHATMSNLRPTPLVERLWALFVYDQEEPVRSVEQTLLDQGISTVRVRNCCEALAVLRDSNSPALVLTDTFLPDGGWADVLKAVCASASYPPLIVVSRLADISLYLDVMESGACDFVVPPLASADLVHVVTGALLKRAPQRLAKPRDLAPSSLSLTNRFGANR